MELQEWLAWELEKKLLRIKDNIMIPAIEDCYFYSRENNIIYANITNGDKIPLIKLHQNFIDVIILGGEAFDYMKRYLEMFPNLWEYIKLEIKKDSQISLF